MPDYPCVVCSLNITGRSQALQCGTCERLQHRKCNTDWHRGLNHRANGNKLLLYVLIPLLKTEVKDVSIQMSLVSENLMTRVRMTTYKRIHGELFRMWDCYEEEDDYSMSQLLRESSRLLGLGPIPRTADDRGEDEDGFDEL